MGKTKAPAGDTPAVEGEPGVAAVNRALSLLAVFSKEHTSLTLAQLSERTELYKSTILRLADSPVPLHGRLRCRRSDGESDHRASESRGILPPT